AAAAADLFLGADCPGCSKPARDWCRRCAWQMRPQPSRTHVDGIETPVFAAVENTATVSRLIVAWKDKGRLRLTARFGPILAASCACALAELADGAVLTLVPVPAARSAVRRRGADVTCDLARSAAQHLKSVG